MFQIQFNVHNIFIYCNQENCTDETASRRHSLYLFLITERIISKQFQCALHDVIQNNKTILKGVIIRRSRQRIRVLLIP